MLRIGVAGPGRVWEKVHQPILLGRDGWSIAAFCVRGEESRALWQSRFPDASVVCDPDDFLRTPGLDAVVVTTPLQWNARFTLRALRAGKHVFVEKPLAVTAEEIEAVAAAARRSGKSVFVLEQQLYNPQLAAIRDIIATGRLGNIVTFECLAFYLMDPQARTEFGYEQAPWRREAAFPLGHIWDGGVHQVSVLNALFGLPVRIFAKGSALRADMGRFDHILALLDYGETCKGTFSQSAFLGGGGSRFDLYFTEGSLSVKSDRLILEDKRIRRQETLDIPQGNLSLHMWTALERLMETDGTPPFTLRDALDCVTFLNAVERSIDSGSDILV